MQTYCIIRKRYTENKNPNVSCTSNAKVIVSAACALPNSKKKRFINPISTNPTKWSNTLISKI